MIGRAVIAVLPFFLRYRMKTAFTMIELVFIIVVLGILAVVVVPRLAPVLDDANFAKGKDTVMSLRTAIAQERRKNVLQGEVKFPQILDDASYSGTPQASQELFDGNATVTILQYPIISKLSSGGWVKTSSNGAITQYRYYVTSSDFVDFNYTKQTGIFDCNHNDDDCKRLTE